jgi:hypothetical protein
MIDPAKETNAKNGNPGPCFGKEMVKSDGYNPEDVLKEVAKGEEFGSKPIHFGNGRNTLINCRC